MPPIKQTTYGPYPCNVVRVVDGDTVRLQIDLGFGINVNLACRMFGINAPEVRTDEGKAAREFLKEKLPEGTKCTTMSFGWDKYGGRYDGWLTITEGGIDIARMMLEAGHAVPYKVN